MRKTADHFCGMFILLRYQPVTDRLFFCCMAVDGAQATVHSWLKLRRYWQSAVLLPFVRNTA